MLDWGLVPDFSPQALAELDTIRTPASTFGGPVRDLRNLLWCAIDNHPWTCDNDRSSGS